MKLVKATFALAALLGLATIAAAQVSPSAPTPMAPPPKGKVAVLNTALFQEQVLEFKAKMDELNRQFEPRVRDVRGLGDRIAAQENTIKTQGQGGAGALSAARIAEMTEQLEAMKKEYQRKAEDLEADASRAKDRAFQPLTEKLVKFAQAYTAKRGIVDLIDLANSMQAGFLLWYDPRMDITADFIAEYNKANPVTGAAPATPKP